MSDQPRKGWATHRWSGWPGAFCLLCGCGDPAEAGNYGEFPMPSDLDKPTPEELEAEKKWWANVDEKLGNCPGNPQLLDPYEVRL